MSKSQEYTNSLRIEKAFCDYCYDDKDEFIKWRGGQPVHEYYAGTDEYRDFSAYSNRNLIKFCIALVDLWDTGAQIYICIDCLGKIVEKYSKETGEEVWISQSGK